MSKSMAIDSKKPIHKKKTVQNNWFKNVGRSLGMSTTELLTDLMPSTLEFSSNAIETGTEVLKDMRDNKMSVGRIVSGAGLSDQVLFAKEGLKNAIDDIKSGNIYNKERIEKLYGDDEDFGLEDFDFDDSSMDDGGFDEPSPSSSKPGVKVMAPILADNAPVVASINAQSEVIAGSAAATIEATAVANANLIMLNHKHTQMVGNGLLSVNNNLETMVNFYSTNMTKYIQASIGYYETSLNHLNSTVEELRKISSVSVRSEVAETKQAKNQWDDVLLSYGGLDLKAYSETVKKNFKTTMEEDFIGSMVMNILNDKDTMKYMFASPLSFVAQGVVKAVIPSMLQTSLAAFDETLSNFFPSLLLKITGLGDKHEGSWLWEKVSSIFGIKAEKKNEINTANYYKEQLPFDGVTKKAITDVIPTYLKKILSALTGKEEMTFDYANGVYRKTSDMQRDYQLEQERKARSGYGDIISSVKARSKAYEFADSEVGKALEEGIDKFFSNLGKSGKFINPLRDSADDFNAIYDFKGDKNLQRLFLNIMQSLDRRDLMSLSKATIDSRTSLTKYYEELERNQELSYQAILSNQMPIDDLIEKSSKGVVTGIAKGSPFNPVDKFNLSSLDYLRRIESVLIEGIRVYPEGSTGKRSKTPKQFGYDNRQKVEEDDFLNKTYKESTSKYRTYSDKDRDRATASGITVLDSAFDLGEDAQIKTDIEAYMQLKQATENGKENQKDSFMKKIGKFLPKDAQGKWGDFADTIQNVISAPWRILAGAVDKLDQTLFNIVFGVNDKNGTSFVNTMIATFQTKMANVVTFFNDKIFEPLHETLFGEDGWFTRFKQSDFYSNMKLKLGNVADYLFGNMDPQGFRQGGLFSDTFNQMKDIFKGFGHYFTGKPYTDSTGKTIPENKDSVFGNIKTIALDAYDATKAYIFGGDPKDKSGDSESGKPITTIIKESLATGATNFHKALFGDKDSTLEDHREIVNRLTERVKDNLPKTLAWGTIGAGAGVLAGASGLGLMGTLLLPGGPIGGAVLGMSLSLLSQSDKFMDKVFGHEDQNGDRVGGLISKSTQDFFKDNKNIILGAGVIGALKPALGLGWLPSFILPGGPIGGALVGVATALAVRSNTFQELMFGKDNGDGDKTGGLLSSFSDKMKNVFGDKSVKEVMGNVGVGAMGGAALSAVVGNMGVMGAMLTPFGPVGGALLGAAAGIGLSSDRWRKAIFGEIDEETGKREGGAFGKLGNWMEMNVLMPMKDTFDDVKVNVYKWFGESIAFPFREALYPIKTEIKYMVEQVNEMFAKGWGMIQNGVSNTLGKYVIKPFGEFMEKHVMSPMRKMLGLALKTSMKALQTAIATPFKMMGVAGNLAERAQERRGKKQYKQDLKQAKKDGRINTLQYIQQRYFDPRAMEDAKASAKVGNLKEAKEKAAESGMTLAQYINATKKEARGKYFDELRQKYEAGEMSRTDYWNARYFDARGVAAIEDKALGTNGRTEYYAKLDADKEKFRAKVREQEDARQANRSRRKYLRQLGMDTGYTGFIYEKDEDGNKIAGGTKVSVDRAIEALSMKRSTMSEDQQNIFNQIGQRLGISNLLDAYGENGLDMTNLTKKNRKKLQQGITSGHVNDLLRGLKPYTTQEREDAFNNELIDLTREYSEKMSAKVDNSNSTLAELENTFKDAYNLLRVKFGLKTVKFTKNKDARSAASVTPTLLALPAPQEEGMEKIVNKLDDVVESIEASQSPMPNLLPAVMQEKPAADNETTTEVSDSTETGRVIAESILSANKKLKAQELYEENEKKKKEEIDKNQEHASRKTASFVLAENHKKKMTDIFFENNLLLSAMSKTMSTVSNAFSWVFGKKGILTGLFLMVLPLILKWLKKKTSVDDSREGANGTIGNSGLDSVYNTILGKGLGKTARWLLGSDLLPKITQGVGERWGKFLQGLDEGAAKRLAKELAEKGGKYLDNLPGTKMLSELLGGGKVIKELPYEKILKLTGKNSDEVLTPVIKELPSFADSLLKNTDDVLLDKNGNVIAILDDVFTERNYKNTAGEVAEKIGKNSDSLFDRIAKKFSKNANVSDIFNKTTASGVDSYMTKNGMETTIKAARESGAAKVLKLMKDALGQFIERVAKIVKAPVNGYQLAGEMMSGITTSTIMARFGSLVGNGSKLTLEAIAHVFQDKYMMIYGAATGAFEASRLFLVYNNAVDGTMAAISAAFKSVMNWKHMWLVELVNEIIADASDIDIFNMIATNLYKLISDDDADFALEMAQMEFAEGKDIYNDIHETNISLDAYNDLVNKYVISDIFDSTSSTHQNTVRAGVSIASKYGQSMLKTYGKHGAAGVAERLAKQGKVVGKVVDKLPFGETLRNTAKSFSNVVKPIGKTISEVINNADLKLIKGFKTVVKKVLTSITNAVSGDKRVKSKGIGKVADMVMSRLSDKVLAKFIPQISAWATKVGIIGGTAATGVGAAVGVIWTALDIGSGVVSGLTKGGAANLFMVDQDVVDWKMRLIAAAIKAGLNTAVGTAIEILDMIWSELTNTSFVTDFASKIYELISDEEDVEKLEVGQIKLAEEATEFNQKEGKSLSVAEYNEQIKNPSLFTKMQKKLVSKKEEKLLREQADRLGITVEELQERKEKRVKIEQGEIGDVNTIVSNSNALDQQKDALFPDTDQNMYNLRKLVEATNNSLNTLTFEKMTEQFKLTEKMTDQQLNGLHKAVTLLNDEFDANTKKKIADTLGITTDALDGVVGAVQASVVGLDQVTLEKMSPIIGISEEKLERVKAGIEAALGGMDETAARKLLDAQQITQEEFDALTTIIDATMSGMNEETLDKLAPILGITEENLEAVKRTINGTMAAVNGEANDLIDGIDAATPLEEAAVTINDAAQGVADTANNTVGGVSVSEDLDSAKKDIDNVLKQDGVLDKVGKFFTGIWEGFKETEFGQGLIGIKNNIVEAWNNSGMKKDLDRAGKYFSEGWTNVKGMGSDFLKKLGLGERKEGETTYWQDIGDKWNNSKAKKTIDEAKKNNKDLLKEQGDQLGKEFGAMGDWFLSKVGLKTKETKTTTNLAEDWNWLWKKITTNGGKEDPKGQYEASLKNAKNKNAQKDAEMGDLISDKWQEVLAKFGIIKTEGVTTYLDDIAKAWDESGLKKKLDSASQWCTDLWSNVTEGFNWVAGKFGYNTPEGETTILQDIKEMGSKLWEGIKSGFFTLLGKFGIGTQEGQTTIFQDIKTSVEGIVQNVKTSVENAAVSILGEDKVEAIKQTMGTIGRFLKDPIGSIADKAAEIFGEDRIQWIKGKLESVNKFLGDPWGTIQEKAAGLFSEEQVQKVKDYVEGVKRFWSNPWGTIKEKAGELFSEERIQEIKDKLTSVRDFMKDPWSKIEKGAKDLFGDKFVESVKSLFKGIKDGIMAPFRWLNKLIAPGVQLVKKGIGGVMEFFTNITSSIGGFGGKGGEDTPIISNQMAKSIGMKTGTDYMKEISKTETTINNILNSYTPGQDGGFGDGPKFGPGAKIIPMGGGKPQPVKSTSVNQSGMGEGGKGVEPDTMNNFAYYAQTDDRYKNHSYDLSPGLGHDSTPQLSARGCGPTSMAMVATQLTGKKYLPTTLADMSRKWGYSVSAGTSWAFYDKAAKEFSMDSSQKGASVTGMRSAINAGQPIIISGRRTKYGSDNSPFTPGGHFVVGVGMDGNSKILINDPRGSKYSKAYDIDKVASESRQFWQFKYNQGGNLPQPDGDYTASNTASGNTNTVGAGIQEEEKLGTWGALSKLTELVEVYAGNIINGTSNRYTYDPKGSSSSGSSGNSSSSGVGSSIIPANLEEAILKKTLELTVKHETGGNYTRVKNDTDASGNPISPSIGIIQMRGNHARTIMQRMAARLPNSSEAQYWANWNWDSRAAWGSSQRQRLENYLNANSALTKEIQDQHAIEYIKSNNLSRVYEHGVNKGKISDPRSIVHLAEIGNTGPAHIKSFMEKYSKHSGGDEFEHYIKQFNSKSFWSRYMKTYRNRLNDSYNILKNWDAKQSIGGYGDYLPEALMGGFGDKEIDNMLQDLYAKTANDARQSMTNLVPDCGLSCDMFGGKGDDVYKKRTSDQVTSKRADKLVTTLFNDIKKNGFSKPVDEPEESNGFSFDPDLSELQNMGGKGETPTNSTLDSREGLNPEDKSAEEIKKLNNNVTRMTNNIISKTARPISETKYRDVLVQTNRNDGASDVLLMEMIELLASINSQSSQLNTTVASISDKEFDIEINNDITIEPDDNGKPVAVINGGNSNVISPTFRTNANTTTDVKYSTAKKIANGRINN